MKPVHLVTCVWGPWHLDMLSRVTWPCILADGNLPAFMRQCEAKYFICTTRRDQDKIRAMPAFPAVSDLVEIEFIDTPTENPEPIFHMDRFFAALREAREAGAIFFNIWPDVVFTDCTLGHAARYIVAGRAGCTLPVLRAVSETCVDDIVARYSDRPGAPIAIPPGELVRLAVRHMHPLSATSVAGAIHGRSEISMLFRVPGEGLIARSLCQWLFLDPELLPATPSGQVVSTDPDPIRLVHVASDSDDMFFLSLAPLEKEIEVVLPNHPLEPIDVTRLTLHPSLAVSPFYDPFDEVSIRLHYGPMTEAIWKPLVDRSEAVFQRVRMMRAFLRICAALKDVGCRQAARLIGLALLTFRLPSDWLIKAPMTIFVPDDRAVEALPAGKLSSLIDRRSRADLVRTMLSHTVLGADTLPARGGVERVSLMGQRIGIRRDEDGSYRVNESARIVSEHHNDRHRIFVIDQCLAFDGAGHD